MLCCTAEATCGVQTTATSLVADVDQLREFTAEKFSKHREEHSEAVASINKQLADIMSVLPKTESAQRAEMADFAKEIQVGRRLGSAWCLYLELTGRVVHVCVSCRLCAPPLKRSAGSARPMQWHWKLRSPARLSP